MTWFCEAGDVLFIVGGIFPIVYLAVRMFRLHNRYENLAPESVTEDFTEPAPGP